MTELRKKVLRWIENRHQEIIDFVCLLVSTPSINPPGNEKEVAGVIQNKLAELDLGGVELVAKEEKRPNLIYRLKGKGGGPILLYNGHMDTKPVGEEAASLWKTDPFTPTIRDGRIFGLGVADMKASVAGMIYATAALKELCPDCKGDLLLVLVADEEAGSEYGARYLVKEVGIKADFAMIGEPQGITEELEFLPLISRGCTDFKIKVYGTQMHSSLSDALPSVNASAKMAYVLWRMNRELINHVRFPVNPLAPGGITVNVGVMVKGGVYYGVYPGYAEFGTDIRLLPGMNHINMREDIEAYLDILRSEDPELRVELEFDKTLGWYDASQVSPDEPFVNIMLSACEMVLERRPPLGTFSGGTDAYAWQVMGGIPTIPGFGPGLLKNCHGPNEWAGVETIIQTTKIYALAAMEFLL